MSFSRHITVLYGIRIPQLSCDEWENRLNIFLTQGGIDTTIVNDCAEYHNIEKSEVDAELLYEYLVDHDYLIPCEFLNSNFLGISVIRIGDDENPSWYDLNNIPELNYPLGIINSIIQSIFPDEKISTYLIDWVI